MCKTWIFKIPDKGFDFRLQTIFQTETETLQCYKDVLRARDYDNIWIYTVR